MISSLFLNKSHLFFINQRYNRTKVLRRGAFYDALWNVF